MLIRSRNRLVSLLVVSLLFPCFVGLLPDSLVRADDPAVSKQEGIEAAKAKAEAARREAELLTKTRQITFAGR